MKEILPEEFKNALEKESMDKDVDFINVCTNGEYIDKHIAGVRSVPLDTLRNHLSDFKTKKKIYVHCISGHRGGRAVEDLGRLGITAELINMAGGLMAWEKAGLRVASAHASRKHIPIMRQVLLISGVLVILGILLSVIHIAFLSITLFIGVGQIFAGSTGWCGLSYFLERMPWNK